MQHVIDSKFRHVITHYRIFRSGEQVIDAVLEKNFWESMAYVSGGGPTGTVSNADLLDFLHAHPQINVVSSYHLRPPKPQVDSFVFFDVFLLRNPLDRLYSAYKYHKHRTGGGDPLDNLAGASELGEFVAQVIAKYPHLVNDSQVCYLASGGNYFRPSGKADLEEAATIVEYAAVPLTTSLLDIALASAEYYLHPAFGELDLSYIAPPSLPDTVTEKSGAEYIREACRGDTYADLLELTQLDMQLLDRTAQEVQRRFKLIPKCEDRLINFKERCASATEYFLDYDDVNA